MVVSRNFKILNDFDLIRRFLNYQYRKQGYSILLAPTFEYSLTHCCFNYMAAQRCRIWEDNEQVVGFVGFETFIGNAIMLADQDYSYLYNEMLEYAEMFISDKKDNKQVLSIESKDEDLNMAKLLIERGYEKKWSQPRMFYDYKKGFSHKPIPEGYELITLNDEDDIEKWDECLWRGFDHGTKEEYKNQFKPSDLDDRATMQSGPNFKKDLAFVIKANSGDYVCAGNLWIDQGNEFAYLEPLATVPEHRRKGLAKILLMEAMKASVKYGAKYCIGGSREFYHCIGFDNVGSNIYWEKNC